MCRGSFVRKFVHSSEMFCSVVLGHSPHRITSARAGWDRTLIKNKIAYYTAAVVLRVHRLNGRQVAHLDDWTVRPPVGRSAVGRSPEWLKPFLPRKPFLPTPSKPYSCHRSRLCQHCRCFRCRLFRGCFHSRFYRRRCPPAACSLSPRR